MLLIKIAVIAFKACPGYQHNHSILRSLINHTCKDFFFIKASIYRFHTKDNKEIVRYYSSQFIANKHEKMYNLSNYFQQKIQTDFQSTSRERYQRTFLPPLSASGQNNNVHGLDNFTGKF